VSMMMWGALAWETSEAWIGGEVAVADGYRAGARSFLRLVGTGILVYILLWVGMVVLMIPLGIVAAIAIPALSAGGGGAGAVVGVTLVVLIGIAALVGLACFAGAVAPILPVVVVEGLGPFRALNRALTLSRGAVLRSGGLVVVAMLIVMLPILAVMAATGQLAAMADPGAQPSTSALFMQQLLTLGLSIFTMPFLSAVLTVLYYDRRVRTEALDVQIAAAELAGPPQLA
jgi:hypothetical protein